MRRRFLVPEVVQTSAMDCGPAALKALFGGFRIYLSYGRLREACQTDVDGTSIDTLEDLAQRFGLDVAQTMMPADLLLLEKSACLPAIIAVRLPDGAPHFVVLWNLLGPFAQIMDPAAGRVWVNKHRFLQSLYIHEQPVPRPPAEEWAQSEAFVAGLEQRLHALQVDSALWEDRIHLDASLRLAHAMPRSHKLRGNEAREFLDLCRSNPEQIPNEFWSLRSTEPETDQVRMRGALLIAVAGIRDKVLPERLPDSLAAVLTEPPPQVWKIAWSAIREGGLLLPGVIGLALVVVAFGTAFEVVLFRCMLDFAAHLRLSSQRLTATGLVLVFLLSLLALEWPATLGLLRLGRHLEMRLRTRLLFKIPRLTDRYFQSRLISDMAFRAHSLQLVRQLPAIAGQLLRLAASLSFTGIGIAWLYPHAVGPALLAIAFSFAVPLLFQPVLKERDLRFRELSGGLGRFYLDAMRGVRTIQAHGAGRALRASQSGQLRQWAEAGLRHQRSLVHAEVIQMSLTLGLLIWLVYAQVASAQSPAGLLVLVYWCLAIPALGRQFASLAWSLPAISNTLVRFLDPLGAAEDPVTEATSRPSEECGARIEMQNIAVVAGGHTILEQIDLSIAPGEHVAIVGLSGSGKSSLVGLLLGWHYPASGSVLVDDELLASEWLAKLRNETTWIDPQVHLFQTTLLNNLCYGNGIGAVGRLDESIDTAGLMEVLQRLPEGLQTSMGEGGTLVSGGEGQQVRVARGVTRRGVRLAILDEPARGLGREERRNLIAKLRQHFSAATLLCVTHDLKATLDFDRILVMEQGRILEQGSPRELYDLPESRYRQLCDEERTVDRHLWSHPIWRRLQINNGALTETIENRVWTHA